MKNFLNIYTILFFVTSLVIKAHTQEIQWANHAGGPGMENGRTCVTDKLGNIYFSGSFKGNECFFQSDTLYQWGSDGMFIVKYDAFGKELWAKRYGNYNNEIPVGFSDMEYDSSSNTIVTAGRMFINGLGNRMVLSKIDSDGVTIWLKSYPCYSLFSGFHAITLDEKGEIYVTGSISTTVNFDTIPLAPGGFIAKFDNFGNCIWAKRKFGYNTLSISEVETTGIKVRSDRIIVSGYLNYNGTVHIDTATITHNGYGSTLLMCFNVNCDLQWIVEGISKTTFSFSHLGIDDAANIYLTGGFYDTINFSENRLIALPGTTDMFLGKFNKNGKVQWLAQTHAQASEGVDLISDKEGNTYVTGYLKGEGLFGHYTVKSISSKDMFLARYNTNGECKGVVNFPNGNGNGLSQDNDGNACFMYLFSGTTQIGHQTFESYGASDFIFAKISAITGIVEPKGNLQNNLLIYANPTTGKCTITIPEEFQHEKQLTLQLFDMQGKLVENVPVTMLEGKIKMNIEAQAKGMYHVTLGNGEKVYRGKVVFE